jgi:hypothetical protein
MSFAGLNKLLVFIRRNIPGSVFTEPKVSSSKIPDDVMEEWESQNLSTTEWSTEFQAVDGTSKFLTSSEEIQAETDFLVDSSHLLLRTPGKRKMDSFAGEGCEEMMAPWKSPKYNDRTFPEDSRNLEFVINAGVVRGVSTATVSKIESYIVG